MIFRPRVPGKSTDREKHPARAQHLPARLHPGLTGPPAAGLAAWESRVSDWGRHIFRDRPAPRPGDISLISNDHLALARHPEVVGAQQRALAEWGAGMMRSGMFVLDDDPQRAFEQDAAELMESPAALVCQSGWDANVGPLGVLLDPEPTGHPVYLDVLAHASLWAGTRGTGAALHPFVHNDIEHLRHLMAQHGPGLVCVDTLYSTTGDQAPLTDLVEACEEFGCSLVADESHSLGVYGPRGAGLVVELGLSDRAAFRTASLAKAFAGRAGLIACTQRADRGGSRAGHRRLRGTRAADPAAAAGATLVPGHGARST